MTAYPNQPQDTDVVLGGSTSRGDAVLGGIEGVKQQLSQNPPSSPLSLNAKIAALHNALNYRQKGINILMQALEDELWEIHQTAYSLLEKHAATQAESALTQYIIRLAKELLNRYEAGNRAFSEANLSGICLQWEILSEIDLSHANLSGAYLNRVDLTGAILKGANFNQTILKGVEFSQANLSHANLTGVSLSEGNLNQAELMGVNLRGADLTNANLQEANLTQGIISWANLSYANLSQANFTHANLVGANLTGADLSDANLRGAKLRGVNLTNANLDKADYDEHTDFPVGFSDYDKLRKNM
ncbi:MAG: pentapeptide repeat-containing protein [Coleofasciculus sp. G1-WW12-02]|uniref:pentapeptide repeat-containing protein n=1 Tax=Coleofasciculus sp. G1-WW12-02 TaxID=3068483 RepID=UPI0033030A07